MAPIARLREALGNRYAISEVVGRGGSATVLAGKDLKYGRAVALKVLHPELRTAAGAERFLAEVRITARLQHPHILPLLDSGQAGEHLYLVTPFVQGSTLADRLRIEGRLPAAEALRLVSVLAEALAYAHRQGVVHLDIKPANILLSNGHPIIADFGIARAATDSRAGPFGSGLPAGTPEYMSPEQVLGGRALDGRSDVYSLTCLLHEMVVGRPPFMGATATAVMAHHLHSAPPSLAEVTRGRVDGLDALVRHGLAKDPADRFVSAEEFAAALREGWSVDGARPRPMRARVTSAALGLVVLAGLAWSAGTDAAPSSPDGTPPTVHLKAEVPARTPEVPATPPIDCPVPPRPLTL